MGYSFVISFILISIAAESALVKGSRTEGDAYDNPTYDDPEACLSEIKYMETSDNNTLHIINSFTSQFTELGTNLTKLVTKDQLENSAKNIVFKTTELLFDLAKTSEVEDLKKDLMDKMNSIMDNVIDKHKDQLDIFNSSIIDEMINMRNETLTKFNSLGESMHTLASKSVVGDIKMKIDMIRERLENMTNLPPENQNISDMAYRDEGELCNNKDSTPSPSSKDEDQTSLEMMNILKDLQESMKTKECDNLDNNKEQNINGPSKQIIEKSDVFGIISVVALVVLFVLVCLLMKRMSAIQNKLNSLQMQIPYERYYRKDSDSTPKALQDTKTREQRNGSIKANPVINMYEDSEMTETLMDKTEA